jgi:FLVCR family MFS transporter 7
MLLICACLFSNNAICYTVGSVHRVSRRYYYAGVGPVDNEESTYDLATLVTIYFLTYVTFSFPTSWFVERWGLKAGVLVGAWLQAAGCFVRVMGTPIIAAQEDFGPPIDERTHGNLWFVLVGQIIASLGQAFFVNPPVRRQTNMLSLSGFVHRSLASCLHSSGCVSSPVFPSSLCSPRFGLV